MIGKNEAFRDNLAMGPLGAMFCFTDKDPQSVLRDMKLRAVVFLCESLTTCQKWQAEESPIRSISEYASSI